MLTEIYIEALLVDEELADQVWKAWVTGERWLEGTRNANLVIDAGESEKAFLLQWLSAGEPSRNEQMPD